MLTDNNNLNIIIGILVAAISIHVIKSEINQHKYDGKIDKWTEWSAGSINFFLSSIGTLVWGTVTALISIFRLF